MIVKVEVKTLRDLWRVAGGRVGVLADKLSLAAPTVSCKLHGRNNWFADEIDAVLAEVNAAGLVRNVGRAEIVKLIGADNVRLRGTLEQEGGGK
jgi:hypothetical protein